MSRGRAVFRWPAVARPSNRIPFDRPRPTNMATTQMRRLTRSSSTSSISSHRRRLRPQPAGRLRQRPARRLLPGPRRRLQHRVLRPREPRDVGVGCGGSPARAAGRSGVLAARAGLPVPDAEGFRPQPLTYVGCRGRNGRPGAERSRLVVRLARRQHRERRSKRALGAEACPSRSANHAQAPTAKPAGDLRRVAGSNLFAQGHIRRRPNAPANPLGRVRQAVHGHAPGFPNGMDNGGNGGGGVRQPVLRRRAVATSCGTSPPGCRRRWKAPPARETCWRRTATTPC